jgi:O-antigen/teichoic acid export membrane protein
MKVFLWVVLSAVAICLSHVLGYEAVLIRLIMVFCLSMLVQVLTGTLVAGLQGLQQMRRTAVAAAAGVIISNGLGLIVLIRRDSLVFYAVAITVGLVIPLVANALKVWPHVRGHTQVDFGICKRIARGGLPFLMSAAILLIYGSIDLPILESLAGPTTVGWYSVAYRWVGLPAFFAVIVGTAVLPSMSSSFEVSSEALASQANKAIRLVFLVGAPIATGTILVAHDAFRLLYPGTGFDHAAPVMQILALHLPVVAVTVIVGSALAASDRQNKWVLVGAAAAVLNIGLNFIAIPWSIRAFQNGAIGAAIVTVCTESLVLGGAIFLRPPGVLDGATARSLLRCALACLIMIPAVLAVDSEGLPIKVVVGALTFLIASIALRVVTLDDLRQGFAKGFRSTGRTVRP